MMKDSEVLENGSPSDQIDESMKQLKVENDDDEAEGENPSPYPDRPGEPDCIYYLRTGTCSYGRNCRFNHPPNTGQILEDADEYPERDGQPECRHFMKTGTCKYGSTCRYHHPRGGAPLLLNIVGLPMRKDEQQCLYYMRTGSCKFGVMCKFHHPQPATAGNALPVTGSSAYGSSNFGFANSSAVPYVGRVSEFSVPKTIYVSDSSMQAPQTYMPIYLSPSQGWSTYMGTMSPSSVTNVPVYPASHAQVHHLSRSVSHLPSRPDQPECWDFVNTGSCKYGSDCKYHHPRDTTESSSTNSLGPLGLPLRPGQAVCSYYSLYGLCKYGPTCKFDHPLAGYLYNYSYNIPSPLLDPSSFPYQWSSPNVHLAETSPSKSSSFVDATRKGEAVRKKEQKSNTRNLEHLHQQTDSIPHSSQGSSEFWHRKSY